MENQYKDIIKMFEISGGMKELWDKYVTSNPYAKGLDFLDTIAVYEKIGLILEQK